ncbi:MAG: hypothetical protein JWO86_6768 [Myxococcaceae bacterium]|jgi:hypothetical protein|nr:hypothetical protein [Myxococcaceae bacterium]
MKKRFCSVVMIMITCLGAAGWSPIARADDDALHVPTARVHVTADDVIVQVDHRDGPEDPWRHACDSPCSVLLPLTGEYRINGGEPFPLHGSDGGAIELAYRGPSSTTTGSILIGVGAVALPFGLLMIARSGAEDGWAAGEDSRNIGIITAIVGGLSLFSGIVSVARSGPAITQVASTPREPTWTAPRASAAPEWLRFSF